MKRWQFWLGVLIGLVCIVLALSQIEDWNQFGRAFIEARYIYFIPVIAIYFFIMFMRSVRWQYIMNQGGSVGLRNTWISILVCYMGNNVFPLRAGELMRVFLIAKQEPSMSYSSALATVVVERLFDFLITLLFLATVLITVPFPEEYRELETTVHTFGIGTLVGGAVIFAFLAVLYARTEPVLSLMERVLFIIPKDWTDKIIAAARKFASGLVIMGRPRALLTVMGIGLALWLVNLTPVWLSAMAFGVKLSFTGCLFLMVVGAAAASIPGPPGFFGIFHYFNQQALIFLMDLDPETALSIAIVIHACYYFPMIAAGAFAAWREGYSLTQLKEDAEAEEESR